MDNALNDEDYINNDTHYRDDLSEGGQSRANSEMILTGEFMTKPSLNPIRTKKNSFNIKAYK